MWDTIASAVPGKSQDSLGWQLRQTVNVNKIVHMRVADDALNRSQNTLTDIHTSYQSHYIIFLNTKQLSGII